MHKIAIIGANEFQSDLIKKAKSLGYETHVFSWGGGEVGELIADFFYEISITEKEEIRDVCKHIQVDGVCSIASDLANVTVQWVASELGFIALNSKVVLNTTNKFYMRKQLALHKSPIPFFKLVHGSFELTENYQTFPLIVKPVDRSGSRGVTKVENNTEIQKAIFKSKEVSFTDEVIVEEFIDGREFSVETISYRGKHKVLQITEKLTTGAPLYIEVAHIAPARLTRKEKNKIEEVTVKALTALEIDFGPSHSEIKLKPNGDVAIIEIGSRMGGDFIGTFLVPNNTKVDFLALVIQVALGQQIDIDDITVESSVNDYSIVYYQITNVSPDISKLKGVKVISVDINKNSTNNVSCSGERYSCTKAVVNKEVIDQIISVIEQYSDSI